MLPTPFQTSLVLTGPTGSGKSCLGIELAEQLGAEIVSMDSMALYRGMDIGTAKPTSVDRARIRHHLIDELDPWESASVAWWLKRAEECCREIEKRGKQVLFVGGTPLYLKALLHGLFDGPPANAELRLRLENEAATSGPEALHRRLATVDAASAARLHVNDIRRVVRALEVWELTQIPLSTWQTQWPARDTTAAMASGRPQILWLDMPRQELYKRIDARVTWMFADGLVDEAKKLRNLPRPISREAAQAVGYKEVYAYCDGKTDLDVALLQIQTRTRNFAKRQITWFRHLPGCQPATEQLTRTLWKSTI